MPTVSSAPKERNWLPIIGIPIGILLLIVVVLLAVLVTKDDVPLTEPSPSITPDPAVTEDAAPSETPSPDPEPEPEPDQEPDPGATFVVFQVSGAPAICGSESDIQGVFFNYATQNAVAAWIGVDTSTGNAKGEPYDSIDPATGDIDMNFGCSEESHTYTITLENSDGVLTHKTTTITRVLAP